MNILWLSWKSITHHDAGGAEIVGHQNAKALVQAGHQVTWVSLHPEKWLPLFSPLNPTGSTSQQTYVDSVRYCYIGNRSLMYTGLFHLTVAVNYIFNWRKNFDFIIDEIHGPPLLTPLYSRKNKLVVIHEVAGEIWHKTIPKPFSSLMQHLIEPLMFKPYHNAQFLIGAETTKQDLIKVGIPEKNIHYIPYGVEVPEPCEYNFQKEKTPTLIFLSALRPMKGFDRVYQAYKEIKKQLPSIQLWVVGDDTTEFAHNIKQTIQQENQVADSITFYGKVSQQKKFELLQRAHILVHGSYKEGWGLVVIEANAMGTPAVVFDAAGLRNAISHQYNGYLAHDHQDFVHATISLLNNPDLQAAYSHNAKQWAAQFSWQSATTQFLALLNSYDK